MKGIRLRAGEAVRPSAAWLPRQSRDGRVVIRRAAVAEARQGVKRCGISGGEPSGGRRVLHMRSMGRLQLSALLISCARGAERGRWGRFFWREGGKLNGREDNCRNISR